MNLKTYQAQSMSEALAMVKKDLGRDAVILHTRSFKKGGVFGLGGKSVVEITAATDVNVLPARRGRATEQRPSRPSAAGEPGRGRASALDRNEPPHPASAGTVAGASAGAAAGLTDSVSLSELRGELGQLRSMVADLVRETRFAHGPSLPEELFQAYQSLLENQVAEEIAYQVLDSLRRRLGPEQLRDEQAVRTELQRVIEASLPVAGGIELPATGRPRVVAFVGPTGVGKTTTIAKLAANFRLRGRLRVGLITIDTYRIAAVDQLRTYAEILDVPLEVVLTPKELRAAVGAMRDRDIVLIDTAGRSQNDTIRINELKSFLAAAEPDEIHLVLASTANEKALLQAVEKFGQVRIDRLIFTKLDEAVGFGVILNVLKRVNKALSYVTMGQDVPDDIAAGRSRDLAALILGEAPAHLHRGVA